MRVIKKVHKWTEAEENTLREMILAGVHHRDIAEKLGVSCSAVENRRMKLGLPSQTQVKEGRYNG